MSPPCLPGNLLFSCKDPSYLRSSLGYSLIPQWNVSLHFLSWTYCWIYNIVLYMLVHMSSSLFRLWTPWGQIPSPFTFISSRSHIVFIKRQALDKYLLNWIGEKLWNSSCPTELALAIWCPWWNNSWDWWQWWPQLMVSLYDVTFQPLPSRGGVYFPTPWFWAGLVICFFK